MPSFFFDVYDGRSSLKDGFGIELETLGEVADQAAALLPDMARDLSAEGQAREFATIVRDQDGQVVYRAALIFRGQWADAAEADGRADLVPPFPETRWTSRSIAERIRDTTSDFLTLIEGTLLSVTGSRDGRTSRAIPASPPRP